MTLHWHSSQIFSLVNCVDDTPTEIGLTRLLVGNAKPTIISKESARLVKESSRAMLLGSMDDARVLAGVNRGVWVFVYLYIYAYALHCSLHFADADRY